MFTASCSKKKIEPSVPISVYEEEDTPLIRQPVPTASDRDRMARLQAIEEERLRQERLRREREEAAAEHIGSEDERIVFVEDDTRTSTRDIIAEDIYFLYNSAALSSAAQENLRRKAEWLRSYPNVSVIIEGHCDDRGTNAYNMALGDRRAESVKAFLANLGISGSRMTTISYGEERPAVRGHSEAARSKNRRAHFVLE
ncbi:peptidoglycan-associated lipoprotein Pal [Desulfobacterales bacterium HSG2]|nr:peptidoglycan-associated lipoprotein Pal [Desulfobacterales bacterium HSG2]